MWFVDGRVDLTIYGQCTIFMSATLSFVLPQETGLTKLKNCLVLCFTCTHELHVPTTERTPHSISKYNYWSDIQF